MAVQTVYNENIDAARVGALADTGEKVIVSRTVKDAAAAFGVPVTQDNIDGCVHPTTTGDTTIFGISVRDRSTLNDEFAVNDTARILKKGVIWVTAAATIAEGEPVHVTVATGAFTNTGGVQIANASYESAGASGDFVKVRLA